MHSHPADSTDADSTREQRAVRSRARSTLRILLIFLVVYLAVAYLLAPWLWERTDRKDTWAASADKLTLTGDGHPGDPINLALLGTEADLQADLERAGWFPADPLSLKNDVKIAVDSVLGRSFTEAPVSNLYYYGRKEDLAFEMPVGSNPRQRHHVRFWQAPQKTADGQPIWFGSATYDERVGLSHTTGQVTHHIAPDVDSERDHVMQSLTAAQAAVTTYYIDKFHTVLSGYNGGGDPWKTDGRLGVVELKPK